MELDTADGRKKYLSEKLDNLLEGINDSYMSNWDSSSNGNDTSNALPGC